MKAFKLMFLLVLAWSLSFGQSTGLTPADNNPKLTPEEGAWLNSNIKTDSFNFDGKTVGFTQLLSGGFYGIGKFTLPLTKKMLFRINLSKSLYTLYILNAAEKKITNGYDAILVIALKKIKGKMKRLKREDVINETFNRYPQIPADAGTDNNSLLSSSNAGFFNELYKHSNHFTIPFDFSGKKIAIFNTYCSINKLDRVSIPEYVARVRKQLDESGVGYTEFTHILTEEQKKASGGYDVIIQYRCKMDRAINTLIKYLAESGTSI